MDTYLATHFYQWKKLFKDHPIANLVGFPKKSLLILWAVRLWTIHRFLTMEIIMPIYTLLVLQWRHMSSLDIF